MKKKFKALLLILLGYTIGEFVTGYRLEPKRQSLSTYTKEYMGVSSKGFKDAVQVGEDFWTDRPKAKRNLTKLMFPNR